MVWHSRRIDAPVPGERSLLLSTVASCSSRLSSSEHLVPFADKPANLQTGKDSRFQTARLSAFWRTGCITLRQSLVRTGEFLLTTVPQSPNRVPHVFPAGDMGSARRPAFLALLLLALALALSTVAHAQVQLIHAKPGEITPSFDVASIREDTSGPNHTSTNTDQDSYRIENLTIRDLIMTAWGARIKSQVEGGRDQLLDQRFDINARIGEDDMARFKTLTPVDRGRVTALMLQALLVDRFQLKVDFDTRELPVFALVIAKGGPKFQKSTPDRPSSSPASNAGPPPEPKKQGIWMNSTQKKAQLDAYGTGMDGLTSILSGQEDTSGRFIVDKTGLAGEYDFSLSWAPEYLSAGAHGSDYAAADAGPAGPSLFTALQDQLGLRLESQKAPVEVLVVDHIEPPSAN
jgi:uncharacterized protein (TIGR03435 family)